MASSYILLALIINEAKLFIPQPHRLLRQQMVKHTSVTVPLVV